MGSFVIKIRRVSLDCGEFFLEIAPNNEPRKYAECASAAKVIKYSELYANKLPLSPVVVSRNAIIISVRIRSEMTVNFSGAMQEYISQ